MAAVCHRTAASLCLPWPKPDAVVLDIDDSFDVVHGQQQLSLFNAYYDERCFLPIHVYDTERSRPVAVILRPGNTHTRHQAFRCDPRSFPLAPKAPARTPLENLDPASKAFR